MSIVTRKLIAKELYVNRWFIGGAAVAAVLSVIACAFGQTAFNIGALSWLTTVIALGVMLAIYGVMNERKEQSLLFVLSLPLSIGEYVRAKLLGLLLSFLAVWLVASGAAAAMVLIVPGVPDGLLPYLLLLCLFLLANFSVVLSGALQARSEALMSATIIITNMAVSVFMFTVGAMPGLKQHMFGPVPVWNHTFFTVLSCELVVLIVALALPLATAARRRDFL
jgi:ABC-type transport system involved in multi-copper enzyme maturation permease subunit